MSFASSRGAAAGAHRAGSAAHHCIAVVRSSVWQASVPWRLCWRRTAGQGVAAPSRRRCAGEGRNRWIGRIIGVSVVTIARASSSKWRLRIEDAADLRYRIVTST